MTHKNGEWFRGKPEVQGNYLWGGTGAQPDPFLAKWHAIYRVASVDPDNYTEGWWVRCGNLYPIPPVPVPRPEKVDTPVLVRDTGGEWSKRHLAGWDEDGNIKTWANGKTKWSVNCEATTSWDQWKLPEDE